MPVEQQSELKQQLKGALTEQVVGIRDRRRVVEETWLRSRRSWMNTAHDERYRPSDTASGPYKIPAGRRSIERTAVRGTKLLTPNVKWFELTPLSTLSEDKASNVDKFMSYVLRKQIKSRSNISQLVRCSLMYGLCHMKTSIAVRNGQVWPSQRPVDPFAFYIFPETASTVDEAEVIFEDFLFSYEKYRTFVNKGIVDDIARDDLTKPDWPYHLVERLAYQGITDPTSGVEAAVQKTQDRLEKTSAGFVSLTELWLSREDRLYQVYIAWNCKGGARLVGFFQSQYDQPLYRSVVHRPLPGELYTNSMAEDITELDTLQNDQLNKFQEAVDWEQGFVAALANKRHDSWKAKGRAVWLFDDDPKNALQFLQPPVTSTNQLRAWQIYLAMINSLAGSGTIAEGQPGRNMPRAGFAVNSLINLGMADVQDIAELIEQEVLTPSLSDIYKVSSEFIPDSQLMRIPGGAAFYAGTKSSILKKTDILGDYEFEWVGSLQFQDDAQRAQRLMIFLNLLMNPQMVQTLQQQGYTPNMAELVKMIWRYGLGERGLSDVVVPIAQVQQQATQMQGAAGQQSVLTGGQQSASAPVVNSNGVPGLSYNLPTVTNGYVQR